MTKKLFKTPEEFENWRKQEIIELNEQGFMAESSVNRMDTPKEYPFMLVWEYDAYDDYISYKYIYLSDFAVN